MTPSDTSDSQPDENLEKIDDTDTDDPGLRPGEIVAPGEYIIEIRDALNTAYHKSYAEDHVFAYRALNTGSFLSRHTLQLQEALRKAESLAQLAESNGDEETSAG